MIADSLLAQFVVSPKSILIWCIFDHYYYFSKRQITDETFTGTKSFLWDNGLAVLGRTQRVLSTQIDREYQNGF